MLDIATIVDTLDVRYLAADWGIFKHAPIGSNGRDVLGRA